MNLQTIDGVQSQGALRSQISNSESLMASRVDANVQGSTKTKDKDRRPKHFAVVQTISNVIDDPQASAIVRSQRYEVSAASSEAE